MRSQYLTFHRRVDVQNTDGMIVAMRGGRSRGELGCGELAGGAGGCDVNNGQFAGRVE